MLVLIKEWSPHIEKSWKDVNENFSNPWRHLVCFRGPEVNIENKDSHADTKENCDETIHNISMIEPESVKNHRKKYKLSKQRNNKRGGRDDLSKEEEEHSEGEQDVD